MAHHEVVENNVKKELSMALVGIVLFLVMVAFIAVMAFLRPEGQHYTAEALNAQASATASTSSVTSTATATAANDASTVASTATGTTATAIASTTDAKPAVVSEAKAQVALSSAEIEAKTGENVDVKAPIASATN